MKEKLRLSRFINKTRSIGEKLSRTKFVKFATVTIVEKPSKDPFDCIENVESYEESGPGVEK